MWSGLWQPFCWPHRVGSPCRRQPPIVLWLALGVAGIPAGILLAESFSSGLTTRRGKRPLALVAMVSGLLLSTLLLQAIRMGWIGLAWPWVVIIGHDLDALPSAFL